MTSGIRFRPSAFTQRAHPHEEFPRVLEIQVISFMRLVWHDLFDADDRLPERVWEAPSSLGLRICGRRGPRKSCAGHDVRVSNRSSHAASGGVGNVLTYPQFRRGRLASSLMDQAQHLKQETMDIGMLFRASPWSRSTRNSDGEHCPGAACCERPRTT